MSLKDMNNIKNQFAGDNAAGVLDESFTGALCNKWAPMLKDIKDPYTRKVTAVLLENQANYFKSSEAGMLQEDTRSTNSGSYLKYIYPVLRRVFPNLIANEIVSVQPMTAPVGGIFYYELKYADTKGKVTAGQKLVKDFNAYYSSEQIDQELVGTGPGSTFTGTLDFLPVKSSTLVVESVSGESILVSGVDDGSGNIAGTGVSGTVNYINGAISLTFTSPVASGVKVVAGYNYNMECNTNIPGLNIDIELKEIRAKSRKLRANWCSEAADDLKAFHGIDADAELTASMAAEIALEIDREIIEELRSVAALSNASSGYNVTTVPSGRTEIDIIRGLLTPITKASNQINRDTLRGAANWMITSPDVSTYIEQLETHGDYRPILAAPNAGTTDSVENPHTFMVYKAGTLSSKYTVYKDVYFPATNVGTGSGFGDILMGYKGASFLDSGAVFSPYVPFQISATFLDPDSGTHKRLARTRYAFTITRPEFYRRVRVSGL